MAPPVKLSLSEMRRLIQSKKSKPFPDDLIQIELERAYKKDKKNDAVTVFNEEYHPSGRLLSYKVEDLDTTITKYVDKNRKSIMEDIVNTLDAIKKQLEGEDEEMINRIIKDYQEDLKKKLEKSRT
jgi:hypothetical protein